MVGFTATLFRTGSDQLGGFSLARSGQPSSPTWASWQWSALTVNCLAASALTCSSRRCSFCPGFLGSASQPRLVVLAGTSLAVSDVAGSGQTSRFTFANWQCSFAASALQAVVKVAAAPLRTGTDQPCSFSFCLQSSAWRLLLFVPAVISFTASALVLQWSALHWQWDFCFAYGH